MSDRCPVCRGVGVAAAGGACQGCDGTGDAMERCSHDVGIGLFCEICGGRVGVRCPRPEPGQIWKPRGSSDRRYTVVRVLSLPGKPGAGKVVLRRESGMEVSWPLSDFADEFWYWGVE